MTPDVKLIAIVGVIVVVLVALILKGAVKVSLSVLGKFLRLDLSATPLPFPRCSRCGVETNLFVQGRPLCSYCNSQSTEIRANQELPDASDPKEKTTDPSHKG